MVTFSGQKELNNIWIIIFEFEFDFILNFISLSQSMHCLGKDEKLTKHFVLAIRLLFISFCIFSPGTLHFFLLLHQLLSELDL